MYNIYIKIIQNKSEGSIDPIYASLYPRYVGVSFLVVKSVTPTILFKELLRYIAPRISI